MMCSLRPEVHTSLLTLNGCFASGAVSFTWMNASLQLIEKTAQHRSAGRRLESHSSARTAEVHTSQPAIPIGQMREDDWEYDDEEDSFGDPDNEDLEHEVLMAEEDMPEEEAYEDDEGYYDDDDEDLDTVDRGALHKKLSPPAGQPSPRRLNNARAVATREMANQKVKGRAKASVLPTPGPQMPERRTPPVPAVANEAIGRAMRYAQMSAQAKMQFTRSGTMRPISIRALIRGSAIPQQDPPGQ